ncbi:MAG: ABC transporter permease, partial [Muribaculaceae bacterium]|nr:ABC transporter permease [Muribaculaceae bacterium]
ITGMIFLMVNIFLGLLGTFWFRTQQRTSEIAIRRVNGATRRSIFRRLIGEGLLLLTIVTPVAAIIDINLALTEIVSWLEWPRMIVSVIAVYIIMALMIVGGIYFPARKAMNTDPAEALHDE